MESMRETLMPFYNTESFPFEHVPKLQALKIAGFQIKDFGGPGLTEVETGAMYYEMAKVDSSIATFHIVHNGLGQNVVDKLGSFEQRKRILTETINMDKILCFGLTEPDYGSDATGLETTATRTKGGYILNGKKRWIGLAGFADYLLIWAKNPEEGNKIQCFVATKGSKGLSTKKISNKYSLRIV